MLHASLGWTDEFKTWQKKRILERNVKLSHNSKFYILQTYWKEKLIILQLNWWKEKPSGSIVCTRKQQPRFYWSCSSAVMKDASPLTPLTHERNSFSSVNNICTIHDPWGPDKYNYTMMKYGATFYIYILKLIIDGKKKMLIYWRHLANELNSFFKNKTTTPIIPEDQKM